MSGRSWRERTCAACGVIRGAGDFKPVGSYRQPWETGSVPPRGLILPSIRGYSDFDELVADLPEARR